MVTPDHILNLSPLWHLRRSERETPRPMVPERPRSDRDSTDFDHDRNTFAGAVTRPIATNSAHAVPENGRGVFRMCGAHAPILTCATMDGSQITRGEVVTNRLSALIRVLAPRAGSVMLVREGE